MGAAPRGHSEAQCVSAVGRGATGRLHQTRAKQGGKEGRFPTPEGLFLTQQREAHKD